MKASVLRLCACAATAISVILLVQTFASAQQSQTTNPQLSDSEKQALGAERQALNAINTAPDATAKLAAATEFVRKFPKSTSRFRVAEVVADEIGKVANAAEAIPLAEKARTVFTAEDEQLNVMNPLLVSTYIRGGRIDDAFKVAPEVLGKRPDDISLLAQMTAAGADQARQNNPKNAAQALQYGGKAIELIEGNKKPGTMSEADWANYKSSLPQLYQQTAILNLVTNNLADAKIKLTKATQIGTKDAYPYALLASIINEEYTKGAAEYQTMPAGPQKQETLKRLEGLLDNIIDNYAHAAGLATGKPEYQELLKTLIPDLTNYYKFRHNQSTEGLQELIDKYKTQP
ncbi:MAG TPA: hypothetical protein VKB46_27025 [Pyrinomonadaceae bacterium]|nr:hypothetical protein [Pyrinomonadaceae bacterium]